MSHQEKQRIFDELSLKKWSSTFEEFLEVTLNEFENKEIGYQTAIHSIVELVFEACDLVQEEQQKRIVENINWDRCKNKGSECRTDKHEKSILNPENLIK